MQPFRGVDEMDLRNAERIVEIINKARDMVSKFQHHNVVNWYLMNIVV